MQEEVELAKDYCPSDCYYRSYIDGGNTPICFYAVIERKCRGCRISECDKYRKGTPTKAVMQRDYAILWEYDYDDEDADIVW